VSELVAVSCSNVRVLVSNCRIVGLCGRFHDFIILEVTVGTIIIVFAKIRVLGGFVVKAFRRAFSKTSR